MFKDELFSQQAGAGLGFQNGGGGEGVTFGRRPELIAPQARNPRRRSGGGSPRKN